MDKYGCGSSVVWNIRSDILLDNVVCSVYFWYYFLLGLCDWAYFVSDGMDWYLDPIENL